MRTIRGFLLFFVLVIGTTGSVLYVAWSWIFSETPGIVSVGTSTAPSVGPADSIQRWMDNEGRIWERAENGAAYTVSRVSEIGGNFGIGLSATPTSGPAAESPSLRAGSSGTLLDHSSPFQWATLASDTKGISCIVSGTGFFGFGVTQPQCPITIHADDGREACLDWRSGTVTIRVILPVAESARLFIEALSTVAPWPPACAQ